MHPLAPSISRWICLLLILPSVARAGTAFRLDAPTGPVVGVSIEADWTVDGILFVNPRHVAKQSFRPETMNGRLRWVSRFGSVGFSMVGRGFTTTGMNESGLVVCTLNLRDSRPPDPDDRHPMDSASWVQYALDTCDTVEEVIAIDETVRLEDTEGLPSHFFVADATGRCAVLEYLGGELVVFQNESLPIPVLTNMRYAKALDAHERGGAPWWWANPDRSAERFAAAAARLAAFDPRANGDPVDYVFDTLTKAVALPTTNWSIAYDPTAKTVRFRAARSPAIQRISFAEIDFSCDSPVLMLPLDASLPSDGAPRLVAYDPGRNLRLFRGFVADHRLGVSASVAADLMSFHDSFRCAP